MIKVLVDSASDYTMEEASQKGITILPIEISIRDTIYKEGVNITRNEFYQLVSESKIFAKTSLVSPQKFIEVFEQEKQVGNEVIYISLSSGLSGTYNSAVLAKSGVEYDKIYLIDSLSASYAIRVLVEQALKRIRENWTVEQIVEELQALKGRITIYAYLDTLEYLKKGGRISSTTAFIGELVNIKPVITINRKGVIEVVAKSLGKNRSIAAMIKLLKERQISKEYPIYLLYSYGNVNCEAFRQKLEEHSICCNETLQIGPTIGAHIGPEAFGIVFVEN